MVDYVETEPSWSAASRNHRILQRIKKGALLYQILLYQMILL